MMSETPPDDLQALWQDQPVAPLGMTIAEVRAKAEKFRAQIAARNAREQIAAALVGAVLGVSAIIQPNCVIRVAYALCVAASAYVIWYMRTHAKPRALPAGETLCLAFYRHELERQRDLGQRIWRWYLGPMVPGLALFVLGWALEDPTLAPLFYAFSCVALFIFVAWLNKRVAWKLQRQIDALPPTEPPPP